MDVRRAVTRSPWRVVAGAGVVVLLFAVLYSFTGFFLETPGGSDIHYQVRAPFENPVYSRAVFLESLHVSFRMFTMVGASEYSFFLSGRLLSYLESLLGMVFIALLAVSLSGDS